MLFTHYLSCVCVCVVYTVRGLTLQMHRIQKSNHFLCDANSDSQEIESPLHTAISHRLLS